MINLILACDKNWGIGKDNDLLFHFPSDLKNFKELTKNKTIVMGRKTWESLPKKLPNRKHIVISNSTNIKGDPDMIISSIDPVLQMDTDNLSHNEIWIIGGAQITELFLPHLDYIHLSKVLDTRPSDTNVSFLEQYIDNHFKCIHTKEIEDIDRKENINLTYQYVVYKRCK